MTSAVLIVPPGLDVWAVTLLLALSTVASFVTIAFGIGGGVLLLAAMASVLPPAALIPVHGVVQFGSNFGRILFMPRHVDWGALTVFAGGSVIGIAVGGAFATRLPPGAVQIGVRLFVMWSVAMRPPAWLRRLPFLTGLCSSVLTMFFGATGPFVATFVRSLGLDRHGHVATHGAMMALQHALKTAMFAAMGFVFGPWLGFCLAMIAAGAVGTHLGQFVLHRISDRRFHLYLNVVLVVLALRLIWQGVTG
jgi:uncharacterized membrane protein YfcA